MLTQCCQIIVSRHVSFHFHQVWPSAVQGWPKLWVECWGLCTRPRRILVAQSHYDKHAALIRNELFDLGVD